MKKDLILSVVTQFVILLIFLLSYKLIAFFFGKTSFEVYSLIKRDITFILAFVGLGLYTAIIRYSSFYQKHNIYVLLSSYIIFLFTASFIACLIFLFHNFYYFHLFFEKIFKINNFYLLLSMFLSLFGIYSHNILYAYLRGISKHNYANVYDVYNKAFIPIVAIFISKSVVTIFILQGTLQIINSFFFGLFLINKNQFLFSFKKLNLTLKRILIYGLKRIGADIGLNILLFLPIIFASKTNAGKIAFSITLLTINGYFFTPLGNVILPRIVHLYKNKNYKALKVLTIQIIFFIFVLSLLLMGFFIIFLDKLLHIFINQVDYFFYINCLIILFSITPFVFYLVMKNIIDALWVKGINSINIILSIIMYLLLILIMNFIHFPNKESISFLISIFFLGILTTWRLTKLFKERNNE